MRFLFGTKRGSSSFAVLNEDQGDEPADSRVDGNVNEASLNNLKITNSRSKNNKRITSDGSADYWSGDLDSTHDLNMTLNSQRTVDSFHTAKTSSNKSHMGYTQTVNKPLRNNHAITEADSVVSAVTTDTNNTMVKKKKKKRFQELFRSFQKGHKRNQKDADMLHNSNTSFAAAVAIRSEIPDYLEHSQEPSQKQSMKVETLGVCESTDQFGFNVSSLDDTGFQSLDPSKDWSGTSNMGVDFYSYDREDVSQMLAAEFSSHHDNNNVEWIDSTAIASVHSTRPSQYDIIASVNADTEHTWSSYRNVGKVVAPMNRETTRFHQDTKRDESMAKSPHGLLPQHIHDTNNETPTFKSPTHFQNESSSSYNSASDDDTDSSSKEFDFSNDSRIQNSSTSSRITLGMMAQISGSVDYSTFTTESTQYGTAYTYEQDDTFDSHDDDEIAQALLLSVDAKDLAVVPNIHMSNSLLQHSTRIDDDTAPFKSNMSEIEVLGFDTEADISSLFDSDQSLFTHNVSGESKESSSLMENIHQHQQTLIKPLAYVSNADETAVDLKSMNDYGPSDNIEKKRFTPSRTQAQVDLWMQKVQKSKETMHPPNDWPETPIKKVPATPTSIVLGRPDEMLKDSFVYHVNDISSEPLRSMDGLPSNTNVHPTEDTAKGISTDLLRPRPVTPTSAIPFFWRSHPNRSVEDTVNVHKNVYARKNENSNAATKSWIKSTSPVVHESIKSVTHHAHSKSWKPKNDLPTSILAPDETKDDIESKSTTNIESKKAFFESRISMTTPKTIATGSFQTSKNAWNNHHPSRTEKPSIRDTAHSSSTNRTAASATHNTTPTSYRNNTPSPRNVPTKLDRLISPKSMSKPPFLVASTPGSTASSSSVRGHFPLRSKVVTSAFEKSQPSSMNGRQENDRSKIPLSSSINAASSQSSAISWNKKSISSAHPRSFVISDTNKGTATLTTTTTSSSSRNGSITDRIRVFEEIAEKKSRNSSKSPVRFQNSQIRDASKSPVRFNASTLSKWKSMNENLGGLWQ